MGLRRALIACIFSAIAFAATFAVPSGSQAATVSLAWDANPATEGVTGYTVWLCAPADPANCEPVYQTTELTASVPIPATGKGCWRATAHNGAGMVSDFSEEACIDLSVPLAPVVLSRTQVSQTPTGASIVLGWNPVEGASAYRIAECPKGSANGCTQIAETVATSATAALSYGTHCFRGSPVNLLGTMGAWGPELCTDVNKPSTVNAFRVIVYVPRVTQ